MWLKLSSPHLWLFSDVDFSPCLSIFSPQILAYTYIAWLLLSVSSFPHFGSDNLLKWLFPFLTLLVTLSNIPAFPLNVNREKSNVSHYMCMLVSFRLQCDQYAWEEQLRGGSLFWLMVSEVQSFVDELHSSGPEER